MRFVGLFFLICILNDLHSQTISGGGTGPAPKVEFSNSEFGEQAFDDLMAELSFKSIRFAHEMPLENHFIHPFNRLVLTNDNELQFHPYNSYIVDFESDDDLIEMQNLRDLFEYYDITPKNLSFPVEKIKSIHFKDGVILMEHEIVFQEIKSMENGSLVLVGGDIQEGVLSNDFSHFENNWIKSKNWKNSNPLETLPRQTQAAAPFNSFAQSWVKEDWNTEGSMGDRNIWASVSLVGEGEIYQKTSQNFDNSWNSYLNSYPEFSHYRFYPNYNSFIMNNPDWMEGLVQEEIQNWANPWVQQWANKPGNEFWEKQDAAAWPYENNAYFNHYNNWYEDMNEGARLLFMMENGYLSSDFSLWDWRQTEDIIQDK
ncbi:MAG: hypothetical protein OXB84_07675 [Halobacteriovoraceae bacterium]|nr:hypothetical protein [Halobacteriovoraceae bacterium]